MAGTTLDRKLTAAPVRHVPFAVATQPDDADIRRLLQANPMPGRITLSLEREPDYFADRHWPGTEKQTVIAREGGAVVCVGSCAIRERFINGQPRRVGYLGELRLDSQAAGRFDILRRGYEFFRQLQASAPADYYFTSLSADNERARNFLERGLPGMPTYEFIGEFVTALLPLKSRAPVHPASPEDTPAPSQLLDCLEQHGRQYQFAACWSGNELAALSNLGLSLTHFCVRREGGRINASAALWNQRTFKQTVIRDYSPWLARARPALNLAGRIFGLPQLPAIGSTLSHAFVSHLAVEPEQDDVLLALISKLREQAAARNIEFITLGLAASDRRLAVLRRQWRFREYRSRIYLVSWPGLGSSACGLDGRCLGPEVALL